MLTPLVLLVTVLAGSISISDAQAASTTIGAVGEIAANEAPSGITAGGHAVQVAEAAGSYEVPAGYARITAWSHRTGAVAGALTFKVLRPTGTAREWTVVATDVQRVVAGQVHTFAVDIAVRPGDRIGLSSDEVELAYETHNTADKIGFFSADLPAGATRRTDGAPFEEFKLDIAATLQSGPTGGDGGPAGGPAPGGPSARPAVTTLRLAPQAFRAARRGPSVRPASARSAGARLTFAVASATTVRFTVKRLRPGRSVGGRCVARAPSNWWANDCTRELAVPGSFSRAVDAGSHSLRFTGRVGGRRLAPGRYVLVATSGAGSTPVKRRFQVLG